MEQLTYFVDNYYGLILTGLIAIFIVAISLFLLVLSGLSKTKKTYQNLMKGIENKNLEDIIIDNKKAIDRLEKNYWTINSRLEETEKGLNTCLKNVALERYDAFHGVGGQQSFSIALLDDNGNGIVITTIHGREDSRTYAKYLDKGNSKNTLSEEEKKVISKALNI